MPRYVSLHTLACLTRQGAAELAQRVAAADAFRLCRLAVNMTEGKMLVEVEAESREAVAAWLAREKFHYDWLLRLEAEWTDGTLEAR